VFLNCFGQLSAIAYPYVIYRGYTFSQILGGP